MGRLGWWVLLLLGPQAPIGSLEPIAALALKDGAVITVSSVSVEGELAVFRDAQGRLLSVRADRIDWERTRALSRLKKARGPGRSDRPDPPEAKRLGVCGPWTRRAPRARPKARNGPSVAELERARSDVAGRLEAVQLEGVQIIETAGKTGTRRIRVERTPKARAKEKTLRDRLQQLDKAIRKARQRSF